MYHGTLPFKNDELLSQGSILQDKICRKNYLLKHQQVSTQKNINKNQMFSIVFGLSLSYTLFVHTTVGNENTGKV